LNKENDSALDISNLSSQYKRAKEGCGEKAAKNYQEKYEQLEENFKRFTMNLQAKRKDLSRTVSPISHSQPAILVRDSSKESTALFGGDDQISGDESQLLRELKWAAALEGDENERVQTL